MTVAGVEVVLLHLSVCLVKVPVIVIETVYRTHYSCAMPPARAVDIKLTGSRIVSNLQKRLYLFCAWIRFIDDGDVNVAHSSSLDCRLLALPGIVSQVN